MKKPMILLLIALLCLLNGCTASYRVADLSAFDSPQGNEALQELLRQAKTKLGVSRGFERFDAGESSYIYIAGGMQSSSGYSVQLKSFREQRDAVLLRVRVNPPPRANTLPAQHNPGLLLQMNKTSKQVHVQWTP